MNTLRHRLARIGLLCALPVLFAGAARIAAVPPPAGELVKDMKIDGHFFSVEARGVGGNSYRTKDPSDLRLVVLKVSGRVETPGTLFGPDFSLAYLRRDGKEDRANIRAVASCQGNDLDNLNNVVVGEYANLSLEKGPVSFAVIFFVESDVESVQLRPWGATPIAYTIGRERPTNVFLTTNADADSLEKARAAIAAGGYTITAASNGLKKDEDGITIHYADAAEAQAREISQRVMLALGRTPSVRKNALIGLSDVVVWIGKPPSGEPKP